MNAITKIRNKYIGIVFTALCIATLSGCGAVDSIDEGLVILDDAINKLENSSTEWQNILIETRDKLIEEGQSTVANEVSNVLSGAIQDAGVETRCTIDFFKARIKTSLIKIRAKITGEKVNLTPKFCTADKKYINLTLDKNRRLSLNYDGYNFHSKAIKAFLYNGNKKETDVSSFIGIVSPYVLNINISCGNGLARFINKKTNKLVLEFNGGTSVINIVQPSMEKIYIVDTIIKSITLIDSHDDCGTWCTDYEMEMQLDIAVNNGRRKWPRRGYITMKQGNIRNINERFGFSLKNKDKLNIEIVGWDNDGTHSENDLMGRISKTYSNQNNWGKGASKWKARQRGNGAFDINYRIDVKEARGQSKPVCQ